jgi:hypothetical protein
MTLLHEALRAGHGAPARTSATARRVLVAGGAGALGAEVLEELLASRGFAQVAVLVTQPVNAALRGLSTVMAASLARPTGPGEDTALVVFDRERHANGREAAFLRPEPAALPALAAALRRRGVRSLIVVMPHASATLPDALKRGLASLDEHAVAALGFDHLVFVRSAQAPTAVRAASAPQRVADWVLSQLQLMIPERERPVRARKVAEFVTQIALQLPRSAPGTRVAAPELVWEAGQGKDAGALAARWLGRT